MKLTVLTDNNTYIDRYYLGEPAVSYYIEDEGTTLLLDTGYSDVYVKNAAAMGIDLRQVDKLILSHAHDDHTGGLVHFPVQDGSVPLIAHKTVFQPRRCDGLSIGAPCSREEAAKRFDLQLSRKPVQVSSHIIWLGEIPRTNGFENREPVGERLTGEDWVPDYLPDDSALVYDTPEGIYVITGCSHSGICNIIGQARRVTGKDKVLGMIGGCHLFEADSEQTLRTADFLAEAGIGALYPCHCTAFAARAAIHARIPVREVGVGLELNW